MCIFRSKHIRTYFQFLILYEYKKKKSFLSSYHNIFVHTDLIVLEIQLLMKRIELNDIKRIKLNDL